MQINTNLNLFTFVGHKTNNGKREKMYRLKVGYF